MIDIIEEYLVKLGFSIDKKTVSTTKQVVKETLGAVNDIVQAELKKAEKTVDKTVSGAEKKITILMEGLKKNKLIQTFINNIVGASSRLMKTLRPMLVSFISSSGFLITGAIAAISAAVVALGVVVTSIATKIMKDAAAADLQTQIFARRLFTTVENARSLQAVMKQLGVSDIEGLNDIALNPELRKQFLELRDVAASLQLGKDQKEGFKNIRAAGLEFQKLGLIMDYFWLHLGADLGKVLAGPLRDIQNAMAGFNRFFVNNMPQITNSLAQAVGIVENLFSIAIKLVALITKPFGGKDFSKDLKSFNEQLTFFNSLLASINKFLDKILGSIETGEKIQKGFTKNTGEHKKQAGVEIRYADIYKAGQQATDKLAYYVQRIFDLLSQVWNFLTPIIRPFRDWILKTGEDIQKNPITKAIVDTVLGGKAEAATSDTIGNKGGTDRLSPSALNTKMAEKLSQGTKNVQQYLIKLAKAEGLTVTSTSGGRHNKGSKHYTGEAIDVDVRGMTPDVQRRLIQQGASIRDERTHPRGQAVWHGAHYHLELTPAKYASIIRQQKHTAATIQRGAGVPGERRKDVEGHVINQHVSINVNGAGDPMATAKAIRNELDQRMAFSTRNMQGSFA